LLFATPLIAQVNCVTTADQLGPYFIANAPLITNDTLAPGISDTSRALQLTFYVSWNCDTVDLDTLSSTYMVEMWHADAQGDYSNVDGNPNNFAYRGKLELSGKSTVFHTELPGIYPYRPSHIHIHHSEGIYGRFRFWPPIYHWDRGGGEDYMDLLSQPRSG